MQSFTLSQTALDTLAKFASNPKHRPSLAGVNVTIGDDNSITLCSTDSYRMHKVVTTQDALGKFPSYQSFFETKSTPFTIPPSYIKTLIDICKLAITMDKQHPVVELSKTKVRYGISDKSTRSYTLNDYHTALPIPFTNDDPEYKVLLNAKYFLDILKEITAPTVTITSDSPTSPLAIAYNEHTHLIMPLKSF